MKASVRTTIVFALVSGAAFLPLTWTLSNVWYWPSAVHLVLWVGLCVYAVLLARWSHTRLLSIVFPLVLLLVMMLGMDMGGGYMVFAAAILGWVRSGICFQGNTLRLLLAEAVTLGGGLALVFALMGSSPVAWSLGLCLFGLVQSLYFYIIPSDPTGDTLSAQIDPFEHALREAEKILESQ